MKIRSTIFALSSGSLPSGVAVIRISGAATRFAIETIVGRLPDPRMAEHRNFRDADGHLLDSGILIFFPGPNSFTGEDAAEFQIHGGRAVVAAFLKRLSSVDGCRHAEAGEFTKRAFLNNKIDLLQAEGLADLIASETEAQRRIAAGNAAGAQTKLYASWRARLIHARAMIEAELDFADEDDVPGSVSAAVIQDLGLLAMEITQHIGGYRKAEIVRDGYDVVIIGSPNAGKSSLLNALARRDAAIVADEPGTTRDLISVDLDIDGLRIRITDTAGIRDNPEKVEGIGIGKALSRAQTADLVLYAEDVVQPVRLALEERSTADVLRLGTKADLLDISALTEARLGYDMVISSETGWGIEGLLSEIGQRAAAATTGGELLPSRERHVALLGETAEFIGKALSKAAVAREVFAEDLRLASDTLGRISGAVDVEDLLEVIFSQFCIGK